MPIKRVMKGVPQESLVAEGIFEHDGEALTSYQQECLTRFGMTYQMEQESYLIMHPEIPTMMTSFVKKMVQMTKRKDVLKEAAEFFTRPYGVIDNEIRQKLKLAVVEPYMQGNKHVYRCDDSDMRNDFKKIEAKYFLPLNLHTSASTDSISNTVSSSFISIITSNTTLPTPEPIPTPEPTLSENMFTLISQTVDKAIFLHVNDEALRYDTAYVELAKAVEEAMEIPVIEVRQDIAEFFYEAYKDFENAIMEKERIAAERAWEKRMRKKLKRTLRRMNNFKGYETPPTLKSEPSSHESYKVPPPRPCICHPQYMYNRYPKDRFGIYLPRKSLFSDFNVTISPAISTENLDDEGPDDKVTEDKYDKKSIISKMSAKRASTKKCIFKDQEN